MSILHLELPESRVLDLFAGSGALGLEALSRGAASADFVERDPRVLRVLTSNTEVLDAGAAAVVHRGDAMRFAAGLSAGDYDVAFADPPYADGWAAKLAEVWLATPFSRILSIEHDARVKLSGATETRRYGSSAITFYRTEV